jgi:hypothetical protein
VESVWRGERAGDADLGEPSGEMGLAPELVEDDVESLDKSNLKTKSHMNASEADFESLAVDALRYRSFISDTIVLEGGDNDGSSASNFGS